MNFKKYYLLFIIFIVMPTNGILIERGITFVGSIIIVCHAISSCFYQDKRLEYSLKKTRVDLSIERDIITGMVVSDRYLSAINTMWDRDLIESSAAKMVANWCLDYWKEYRKAPSIHIQHIYEHWKRKEHTNEDQSDVIESLLLSISGEYEREEQFNVDYLLDRTELYFKKRRIKITIEEAEGFLLEGEAEEAERIIKGMRSPCLELSLGINPYTDREAIMDAFEHSETPLFKMPGAVGEMLNNQLIREGFISIMAPEKRGKTFFMIDLAHRAVRCRCNVAFLGAGDMSRRQMIRRMQTRLTGRTRRTAHIGEQWIPVKDCPLNQKDECPFESKRSNRSDGIYEEGENGPVLLDNYDETPSDYLPCTACEDRKKWSGWVTKGEIKFLDLEYSDKMGELFEKRCGKDRCKVECWPNDTLTVDMINNQLDLWLDSSNWAADVVIIDYADIMDASSRASEERHKVNKIWKGLRRLSQERRCLVITATQADASSYDASILGMRNFSEDKRKFAHVTGMFGLNQTPEEKHKNLLRLNWLVLREDEYNIEHTVHILQNLKQGKPVVDSW